MKAPDILKAAAGHMEDRAATYDKPEGERSMAATVSAFRCVTGHSLTEEQGWLFMQLLKAVRSQQGGYRADSYEDGAAYASLAGEAAYRERYATKSAEPYPDTVLDLGPVWDAGEERMRNIASSHGDGEHYAEDMTDPANWRAGDLVECVKDGGYGSIDKGEVYQIQTLLGKYVGIRLENGRIYEFGASRFRFHSRPSQVNEAEMSGIWHHWTNGNASPPPCDDRSELEIQYEGCENTIRTFGIHVMWDRNLRYRML